MVASRGSPRSIHGTVSRRGTPFCATQPAGTRRLARLRATNDSPAVLYDKAKIYVEGGRGGNGVVCFRREAHVPRGGRTAATAGRGGDVVLVCDAQRRDLASLGRSRHFRAGGGGTGKGKRDGTASAGRTASIAVPPGTVVRASTARDRAARGRPAGRRRPRRRGRPRNKRFATSTRQAPRFAERGLEGESGWIELRLKLLADVGLVGLPNAGKSSLLARLTRAAPKVADYPFTTVEPELGTIELDDRQLVLADIPGLIEGAAEGAGLGHEFLAHVERCRLLVHLVEIAPAEGGSPRSNYETVRERARRLRRRARPAAGDHRALEDRPAPRGRGRGWSPSGASASGLGAGGARDLVGDGRRPRRAAARAVFAALPEAPPADAGARGGAFEAEHRVYRPGEEEGFEVVQEGDGSWRVTGRGIELLIARHDLANPEALDYLEGRLREIGVIAGFSAPDSSPATRWLWASSSSSSIPPERPVRRADLAEQDVLAAVVADRVEPALRVQALAQVAVGDDDSLLVVEGPAITSPSAGSMIAAAAPEDLLVREARPESPRGRRARDVLRDRDDEGPDSIAMCRMLASQPSESSAVGATQICGPER